MKEMVIWMKNSIEFERVWQEDSFFEMKITCRAEMITATTQVYISDENVDELCANINRFLNENTEKALWKCGIEGDDSTACFSLNFMRIDRLGHVHIEVYMELNDGGPLSKHNCCFFINTENGLLYEFLYDLPKIKQKYIGMKVILGEER